MWTERRQRLRTILAGQHCIYPGSVFDAISMRIAEEVGFEMAVLGGSVASLAVLGAPDLNILTLTEFAGLIGRITRAGNLPLLVDADNGYGNALNAMRTVQELEAAGVGGLIIEDAAIPAPYGGREKNPMTSIDEAVGKLRAALSARSDPSTVIVARVNALASKGVEEAIARCQAYQEAGADAIFLIRVKTREQMEKIAAVVKKPIILGNTVDDMRDPAYLVKQGVRVCFNGHDPFPAAVQAVYDTMTALRNGTRAKDLKNIASDDLMDRVTRDAAYARQAKDFLGG